MARGDERPAADYLREAAAQPAHIVFAMDMRDMFDPDVTRQRLEAASIFAGRPRDIPTVLNLLAKLRGITFIATVGRETAGEIRIDNQTVAMP